ncbi:hypothetical protein IV203_032153 [Nitzschia inconspicua]|uniref:Uncharacterized protein n=1 Tax=Nitzschia inconspicua TaxID=303405 RepID=A0A9K3LVP6_9STRA|nr:hypothetical protein IV203_032153 [Nitzschia inconspicua]
MMILPPRRVPLFTSEKPKKVSFVLLVAWMFTIMACMDVVDAFQTTTTIASTSVNHQQRPKHRHCAAPLCSTVSNTNNSNRPDLVDQNVFIAAIERVEDEIAMAMQSQQQQEEQQQQDTNDSCNTQKSENEDTNDNNNNNNMVYAIGRIFVDLPVDQQPELDLTESVGPMVLVTGVWGKTAEISGLQPFDTITQVTVGSSAAALTNSGEQPDGTIRTATSTIQAETTFAASCKQSTLEETAAILTAAAQHALQNGKTMIQLEVNRLIQGYYAPPPTQPSSTPES